MLFAKRATSPRNLRRAWLALAAVGSLTSLYGCELILPPPEQYLNVSAGGAGGGAGHGGATSTAASGGAGAGGASTGAPPCCSGELEPSCVGYPILRVPSPPAKTGHCDVAPWTGVPEIQFAGNASGAAPAEDAFHCKLVWQSAPRMLYGCCEVEDAAIVTRDDAGTSNGNVFGDDGFDYILASHDALDADAVKCGINAAGARYAVTFEPDGGVAGADPAVMLSAQSTLFAGGYTIEWSAALTTPTQDNPSDMLYCNSSRTIARHRHGASGCPATRAPAATPSRTDWTSCRLSPNSPSD